MEDRPVEDTLPSDRGTTPRSHVVSQAIKAWTRQLVDLGGRNNLLYFRDLKVGTLDITVPARSVAGEQLLSGKPVRLSHLFTDPVDRKDAAKRARTLHAKAIENLEERGLQTLHVGFGLATWKSDRSASTPNAPVALYSLSLSPIGAAREDFVLELEPEPEFNPTLAHLMLTDFGLHHGSWESDSATEPDRTGQSLVDLATRSYEAAPGFGIADRLVVGNFSYAKLPMVLDLQGTQSSIEEHDLLSAIAGDEEARSALREKHRIAEELAIPVVPPPADEFLILDADSSQSRVVGAGVSGADLVVIGPPGTGKSQTISNLIATLAARGRSVLFVAEKRAAIDAVIDRLERRNLGGSRHGPS